jgi:hypothetical protein
VDRTGEHYAFSIAASLQRAAGNGYLVKWLNPVLGQQN